MGARLRPAALCANLCAGRVWELQQCNWAVCNWETPTTMLLKELFWAVWRIPSFMLDILMTSPAKLCPSTLGAHDRRWGLNLCLERKFLFGWCLEKYIFFVMCSRTKMTSTSTETIQSDIIHHQGYPCMVHVVHCKNNLGYFNHIPVISVACLLCMWCIINFRNVYNLNWSVVEKLLPSLCRKPTNQSGEVWSHTFASAWMINLI